MASVVYQGVEYDVVNNGLYLAVDKVGVENLDERQVFFAQGDDLLTYDDLTAEEILEYLDSAGVI